MQSWKLGIASWLVVGSAIAFSTNGASAQITPDSTLPNNSRVTSSGNTSIIEGGTRAGNNLFHSFEQFSVPTGGTAFFNNALNIQNIISRITGGSVSNIDGIIRANGTANLFLINPNGIIFGRNASLNIGGSFLASTANAIGFGEQGFFGASNPESPSSLLTVNPSALLFNQIQTASIQNNSVAPSGLSPSSEATTGLRVPDGKSLLLVGGDINMDGGGLYAFGGRVELGGSSGAGTVELNEDGNNLSLTFPKSVARSDVFLSNGAEVDVAAGDGGSIAVNARNLEVTGSSSLNAGIGSRLGSNNSKAGNIDINVTEAINLNDSFIQNQVQSEASGQGGDINIKTNTLLMRDGAQVSSSTFGAGKGGNLRVDVSDVQLIGTSADGDFPSGLGANAQRNSTGDAGNLTIKTNTLLVQNGAGVTVESLGTGTAAGNLTIDARSIRLNNNAILTANTLSNKVDPNSQQATININSQDLIMSRNSNIITNATGVNVIGGNININSEIIAALENSDISANSANFRGGRVKITTQGIFGTEFRGTPTSKSDITATGGSPVNTLGIDPTQGLANVPVIPVDTQVAQSCYSGGSQAQSEFIITGRGGLPPNPGEALNTDAVQVDLVTLNPQVAQSSTPAVSTHPTSSTPERIVEANGWIVDADGNVVLTANAPTLTPHSSWHRSADCRAFNQHPGS